MDTRILGIGTALVDILINSNSKNLSRLNLKSGDYKITNRAKRPKSNSKIVSGGSCANTICALANLNFKSAFFGALGNDDYATLFKSNLAKFGVKDLTQAFDGDTACRYNFLIENKKPAIVFKPGVANSYSSSINFLKYFDVLYVTGDDLISAPAQIMETLDLAKNMRDLHDKKMYVAFNLGSTNLIENNFDLIQHGILRADFVFANASNVKAYCGSNDFLDCLDAITINNCGVLDFGNNGAVIKKVFSDPIRIEPIHSTEDYSKSNCNKSNYNKSNCIESSFDKSSFDKSNCNKSNYKGCKDLYRADIFIAGFLAGVFQNKSLECAGNFASLFASKYAFEFSNLDKC